MVSARTVPPRTLNRGVQTAVAIVGMAFYWKFFRSSTSVQLLLQGFSQLCGTAFDAWIVASYVLGAMAACAVAACGRIARGIGARPLVLALGALSTLCLFCPGAIQTDWSGAAPLGFVLLAGCLLVYAASLVAATCAWSTLLSGVPGGGGERTPLFVVAISLLLDLVLSLVDLVAPAAGSMLGTLAPLVSAGAYAFASMGVGKSDAQAMPSGGAGLRAIGGPAAAALRLGLVFVFFLSIVTKELSGILLNVDAPDNLLLAKNIITLMELALVVSICLVTDSLASYLKFGWLILAGLFLAETLVAAVGSSAAAQMAYVALFTVPVCFEMFTLQLVVASAPVSSAASARMACLLVVLPEMGAHAVGHGVVALLGLTAAARLAQDAQLLACIIGVAAVVGVFAVVCVLAFRRPGGGWAQEDRAVDSMTSSLEGASSDSAPEKRRAAVEPFSAQAIARLAAEHGLTPRETDMVGFICKGYANKRISELCCVSINTVQTHIQNCYRKLGVHTRQGLIDLLEAQARK